MVLHEDVLPDPGVRRTLASTFALAEVDVDEYPRWMDLPDVDGLPSLIFFDRRGRHVLSKSGYRPAADLIVLLRAVSEKLDAGRMEPYERRVTSSLPDDGLSPQQAAKALKRYESKLFIRVNSNDGGFGSPSRDPRPKLLLEMSLWPDAPARVREWVDLTVESANRGSSPNLEGKPLPDMDFSGEDLARLSRLGAQAGERWREGIDTLPTKDPYLGVRDPVDHGFFRYAAGPGWYHPHFERLAAQNLAWVLLFRARDADADARRTHAFVNRTFARGEWFDTAQASDPFYYRLPAPLRDGVPPPAVAPNASLEVQAWATRVDPSRCATLAAALDGVDWPANRMDGGSAPAPVDAVGETLIALSGCGENGREVAAHLGNSAVARWEDGLPAHPRLHRLAAGLCAADHPACARALSAVREVAFSEEFAPPLVALAELAP